MDRQEDEYESRFSPIDARCAIALLPRLPRSCGVAGALDGRGEGSSARQKARRVLHALPRSPRRVRPVEKNHPKPRRQYVEPLGGEIIRDVNENPSLRKVSAEQLVCNVIHENGGPLIHNITDGKTSSAPSTPRAGSSTVSSLNPSAEPAKLPTDSPVEPLLFIILCIAHEFEREQHILGR